MNVRRAACGVLFLPAAAGWGMVQYWAFQVVVVVVLSSEAEAEAEDEDVDGFRG